MPALLHLTPNLALFTATAGICLIFLELNRPGLILPGALGLLLALCAIAALLRYQFTSWAVLLLITSAALLAVNLYRLLPLWVVMAITVALIVSLRFLVNPHPGMAMALTCGTLLGVLAAALSRIALRARQAKAIH